MNYDTKPNLYLTKGDNPIEVPDVIDCGEGITVEPVFYDEEQATIAHPYQGLIIRFAGMSSFLPLVTPFTPWAPQMWTVKQWYPLTLSPSVNIKEMFIHGWIVDGEWKGGVPDEAELEKKMAEAMANTPPITL